MLIGSHNFVCTQEVGLFNWLRKRKSPDLVGLEIRPDGVAFARSTRKQGGERELVFHEFVPCNAAARRETVESLVRQSGSEGVACNLVLSPSQFQVFQLEKPEVAEDELAASVHWKLSDLIDYPVDEAISDVFPFPDDAARGRSLINVACARKSILEEYVALVEACHLELTCIDITDLALRNIASSFVDASSSIGFLYLRPGLGLLVLVKGDVLYLSRKITVRQESLSNPADQEATVQQLSLEVQRSLDYFESQMQQIPPRQLLMFGPDVSLPLPQLLDPLLGVSVEDANFDDLLEEQNSEVLTMLVQTLTAVGAALREDQVS